MYAAYFHAYISGCLGYNLFYLINYLRFCCGNKKGIAGGKSWMRFGRSFTLQSWDENCTRRACDSKEFLARAGI